MPSTGPYAAPTSSTANVCSVIGTGVKPRWNETCAHERDEAGAAADEQRVDEQARAGKDGEAKSRGLRCPSVIQTLLASNFGCAAIRRPRNPGSQLERRVRNAALSSLRSRSGDSMRDIISILERWTADGRPVARGLRGRADRLGAARSGRDARGLVERARSPASVTGGCVEPAVIREATEVLNGSPGRICRYGLDDDEGFDVGLTCGGSIAVAVYAARPRARAADRRGGRERHVRSR